MASINIDGKEYEIDDLSENAKQQLASLQFVQAEVRKLESQLAVYKTAGASYTTALKQSIES